MDVMVRELRWDDADALISNYYSLLDEAKEDPLFGIAQPPQRPDLPSEYRWFSELYAAVLRGDAVAYVAEADGRVVGMAEVRRRATRVEFSHIGVLGMYVVKGYRGKGIGKALLRKTIEGCRGKFEIIVLEVLTTNTVAKRLYQGMGFRTYGLLPGGVKRGDRYIDVELMYLRLV
jgi:ribosomal protein S18 acetylase RimI-like enzyme